MEPGAMISAAPKVVGLLKGLRVWLARRLVRIACLLDSDAAAAAMKFPPLTLDEGRKLGLPICAPNPDHPRSAHVCMVVKDDPQKQSKGIKLFECPECGGRQEVHPIKRRDRAPVRSSWLNQFRDY